MAAVEPFKEERWRIGVISRSKAERNVMNSPKESTQEGRQAYWVCTLIEESDLLEAQAAEATWEELKLALPELNVGLVHGRMKPAEKQAVMAAFKQGELHLLVATTVIEVGVDINIFTRQLFVRH